MLPGTLRSGYVSFGNGDASYEQKAMDVRVARPRSICGT